MLHGLRDEYTESLPEEVDDAFGDLIEALRFFGPTREYFETLYVQWGIMKRTLAIGPFIVRETEQLEGIRNEESGEIRAEK